LKTGNKREAHKHPVSVLMLTTALCLTAPIAFSQEGSGNVFVLDPITVTSQRYKSHLEDVPASVDVITGEELEKKNIRRLSEALRLVPNIQVYDDGGSYNTAISVRGIGNEIPFTEPATTVFIDGIPYSGNMSDLQLQNVERIEVMRGPQSTLYGENTLAGAVNIVTRKRQGEKWQGLVKGSLGNLGRREASASISGPIVKDKMGLSVDMGIAQNDGYLTNVTTGNDDVGEQDNKRIRTVVDLSLTDNVEASFSLDYDREEGAKTDSVQRGSYNFARTTDPDETREGLQGALSLTWYGSNFDVTSLTGFRDVSLDLKDNMVLVVGNETLNLVDTSEREAFQEFRLIRPKEETDLGWQLGAYISVKDFDLDQNYAIPAFATTQVFDHRQKSLRTEAYGQVDFDIISDLTLTVGGRLSRVKRSVDHEYIVNNVTLFETTSAAEKHFNNIAARAALTYRITDGLSVYGGYNQGFKAGTARSGATSAAALFLPSEKSRTFEIGAKGQLSNLSYSASLFYTDYKNRHTFFNNGGIPVTEAIPDATSKGAELSLRYAFNQAWNIYGRAGYLTTEFGNHILTGTTTNIKGNEFRDAPKWTLAAGADYTTDIGNGWQLSINGDVTYRSSTQGNVSNIQTSINPSYTLVDTSIGLRKDNFAVSLTAKNLLDEYYYLTTAMNDGTGAPGAPRSVFLTASYNF